MAKQLLLAVITLSLIAAAPSDKYNLPVQRRTRDVVQMKRDAIPLRFSDGTLTGLRISIGTDAEVDALLTALPDVMSQ